MEPGKEEAVKELQSMLGAKFGDDQFTQEVISKEISALVQTRKRIRVKDLDALEVSISKELTPHTTKSRLPGEPLSVAVLRHSVTPVSRWKPLLPASPRQERLSPTAHLQACNEVNQSVPSVGSIVPVTTGKRRPLVQSPTALFPRVDGVIVSMRVSPEVQRHVSPIDFGHSEENRFRGTSTGFRKIDSRREDSWGRVIKYDTAKYLQEEATRKSTKLMLKQWYRRELDKQLKSKEEVRMSEKLQMVQRRGELEADLQRFEEEKKQRLEDKVTKTNKHVTALDALTSTSMQKRVKHRLDKAAERQEMDETVKKQLKEKEEKDLARKVNLVSLQHLHQLTAAEKVTEERSRKIESRMRERDRLEREQKLHEETEKRQFESKRKRDKQILNENQMQFLQRKDKSPIERQNLSPPKLFLDADKRAAEVAELKAETLAVLSKQRLALAERPKALVLECDSLLLPRVCAESPVDGKKRLQQSLRDQLESQVAAKEQQRREQLAFSPAEAQLNKALIDAANAFLR